MKLRLIAILLAISIGPYGRTFAQRTTLPDPATMKATLVAGTSPTAPVGAVGTLLCGGADSVVFKYDNSTWAVPYPWISKITVATTSPVESVLTISFLGSHSETETVSFLLPEDAALSAASSLSARAGRAIVVQPNTSAYSGQPETGLQSLRTEARRVPQYVDIAGLTVERVVNDRAFWLGLPGARGVLVISESARPDIRPGQQIEVSGTLEQVPDRKVAEQKWGPQIANEAEYSTLVLQSSKMRLENGPNGAR